MGTQDSYRKCIIMYRLKYITSAITIKKKQWVLANGEKVGEKPVLCESIAWMLQNVLLLTRVNMVNRDR